MQYILDIYSQRCYNAPRNQPIDPLDRSNPTIERRNNMFIIDFLKDLVHSAPTAVSISSDSSLIVSGEYAVRVQR